jgi:hypothetical protein
MDMCRSAKRKTAQWKKRSFSLVRLKTHGMIYNMALLLLLLLVSLFFLSVLVLFLTASCIACNLACSVSS